MIMQRLAVGVVSGAARWTGAEQGRSSCLRKRLHVQTLAWPCSASCSASRRPRLSLLGCEWRLCALACETCQPNVPDCSGGFMPRDERWHGGAAACRHHLTRRNGACMPCLALLSTQWKTAKSPHTQSCHATAAWPTSRHHRRRMLTFRKGKENRGRMGAAHGAGCSWLEAIASFHGSSSHLRRPPFFFDFLSGRKMANPGFCRCHSAGISMMLHVRSTLRCSGRGAAEGGYIGDCALARRPLSSKATATGHPHATATRLRLIQAGVPRCTK